MAETILVVIAVLAALAIFARRSVTGGSSFPEPLESPDLEAAEKKAEPEETISP